FDMVAHVDGVLAHASLQRLAEASGDVFRESAAVATRLRSSGWHQQADELAIERLRTAWRLGAWAEVDDDIADLRLHAFGERRDLALSGWFAEAVARYRDGDADGSVEACTKGLEFLDDITAE